MEDSVVSQPNNHDNDSNNDEDEDEHLCLRCQTTFHTLDDYVRHRRNKNCTKNKSEKDVNVLSDAQTQHQVVEQPCSSLDFFQSLNLQARVMQEDQGEAEQHHDHDQGEVEQHHDQGEAEHRQDGQDQSESRLVESERSRRPSSEQAAYFMETLGLHLNTSSRQSHSPTRREPKSPGRNVREQQQQQDHADTWDENLLLWPIEQMDLSGMEQQQDHHQDQCQDQSQQQQDQQKSSKPRPPTLMSFKHQCQHDVMQQQQQQQQQPRTPLRQQHGSLLELAMTSFAMMSPSQNEFMRQMDLMNVTTLGVVDDYDNVGPNVEVRMNPTLQDFPEQQQQHDQHSPHRQQHDQHSPHRQQHSPLHQHQQSPVPYRPRVKLWNPEESDKGVNEEVAKTVLEHCDNNDEGTAETDDSVQEVDEMQYSSPDKEQVFPQSPKVSVSFEFKKLRRDSREDQQEPPVEDRDNDGVSLGRGKRLRLSNRRYDDTVSDDDLEVNQSPKGVKVILSLKSRSLTGGMMLCPTCDSKTPRSQFGKHLISHYHLHHSKVGKSHPAFRELIFGHMEEIVRLSPFRCDPCGFYFNWDHEFLEHWRSAHEGEEEARQYWCSFCSFVSEDAKGMTRHLLGEEHGEIVAAISRVVPIVIRRHSAITCQVQDCGRTFRLRFSLKRHLRRRHGMKEVKLEGQEKHQCPHCPYTAYSTKSRDSHVFLAHPETRLKHYCKICQLEFDSKKKLDVHRRSQIHKDQLKPPMKDQVCDFCNETFEERSSLKDHLLKEHPKNLSQCGICGSRFANPQDLGAHVRSKCKTQGLKIPGDFRCGNEGCAFECDSLNMLLFHRALRHGNNNFNRKKCGSSGLAFPCNLCGAVLATRNRLWDHVKVHGQAHRCRECYRVFDSAEKLADHMANSHKIGFKSGHVFACPKCDYTCFKKKLLDLHLQRTHFGKSECEHCGQLFTSFKRFHRHKMLHKQDVNGGTKMQHLCSHKGCGHVALTATDLKKHMLVHSSEKGFKCSLCDFACKRKSELTRHQRNKHEKGTEKQFQCSDCDYQTSSNQHLKRHVVAAHSSTGAKMLHCRLCEYTTTSQDLLRKHVVKNGSHSGASLYDCDYCEDFRTDSLNSFKSHVVVSHNDIFQTKFEAIKYVSEYFYKL